MNRHTYRLSLSTFVAFVWLALLAQTDLPIQCVLIASTSLPLSLSVSFAVYLSLLPAEVASNSASFNYVQHLLTGLFAFASVLASVSVSAFPFASAVALSKQCVNKGRGSKGTQLCATVCWGLRRTTICFE